jgi:hypothetical protein
LVAVPKFVDGRDKPFHDVDKPVAELQQRQTERLREIIHMLYRREGRRRAGFVYGCGAWVALAKIYILLRLYDTRFCPGCGFRETGIERNSGI